MFQGKAMTFLTTIFYMVIVKCVVGQISYHNGNIMSNGIKVYYIWYGNFSTSQKNLVANFTRDLNSSSWWDITRQYNISGIGYNGAKTVQASSKLLAFTDIENLVKTNAGVGNTDAIYVVLTDKTVNQRNGNTYFCKNYCGWHSTTVINGKIIKFAWIGSPLYCAKTYGQNVCSGLSSVTNNAPNGNFEIDSFINTIAHEITETATDPSSFGWYDTQGNENADKCAWQFGNTSKGTLVNPSGVWNQRIGNRCFYIQNNWRLLPVQGCSQK